jgi:hypothetical protein
VRKLFATLAALAMALGIALVSPAAAPAVVNGSDAVTNQAGAVSLWTQVPYRNRCTGILIDDGGSAGTKWVLTAAHCIYSFTAPDAGTVEARIGAVDNTTGGDFDTIPVVDFTWHPSFDPNNLVGDIMLAELAEKSFKPAVKWNFQNPPVGLVGEVNGFGWVCDGPAGLPCSSWYQGPLQRYSTHTLPSTDCVTAVSPEHACFESLTGDYRSACLGDSGAGNTTKVFNGSTWERVAAIMVLGDGDDWNGASCITAPDGSNGLGLGIKIAPYRTWMQTVIDGAPTARTAEPILPPATPYALSLVN